MSTTTAQFNGPASRGAVRFWRGATNSPAAVFALAAAALVAAPLISLIVLAIRGDTELWPHLAAYVIPQAIGQTALLVAGVSLVAGAVGAR